MLKQLSTLFPLLHRYRWSYVLGIVALIITSGGQLLIPWYTGMAVDQLVSGTSTAAGLVAILLRMVAVAAVVGVARFGWRLGIHGASRRIEADLRRSLYHHLTLLSTDFYDELRTGDLMARATNDMNAVRMATGMALVAFFDGLFMTIAILSILIARNARLALLTVIPLPFITILIISLGTRVRELFSTVQRGFSGLSEQAQEVFSGVRVVKSFAKEEFFLRRFSDANDYYQRQNMTLVRMWGFFFPIVGFLSGITVLILLYFGGRSILAGTLSPGEFVATLAYLQMLIWPMLGAGFTVNMLQRGAASIARINDVLNTEPSITNLPNAAIPDQPLDIRVEHLSVRYPDGAADALSDVSFELTEGQMLGIIGRTGSGKSTLLESLPRLIDPPPGSVFIAGRDVRDWDIDSLRRNFGFVPQNTFLFSATIKENIAFARPDANEELILRAGKLAALDRDVQDFPAGWDTVVGERGVTLSGGQKQRIALARALLADPDILVLDDSLSAVDSKTEEQILAFLHGARKDKTTIIVTNRVSIIRNSDLVLVFDDARVVQRGKHSALVKAEGLYRELWRIQQMEEPGTVR